MNEIHPEIGFSIKYLTHIFLLAIAYIEKVNALKVGRKSYFLDTYLGNYKTNWKRTRFAYTYFSIGNFHIIQSTRIFALVQLLFNRCVLELVFVNVLSFPTSCS